VVSENFDESGFFVMLFFKIVFELINGCLYEVDPLQIESKA
jgi:hypothetical protein